MLDKHDIALLQAIYKSPNGPQFIELLDKLAAKAADVRNIQPLTESSAIAGAEVAKILTSVKEAMIPVQQPEVKPSDYV